MAERQGWIGDTLWDQRRQLMSWRVSRSFQPRNQWPEPARFSFIGNSVIEFAPSGAYVEDWRQQSTCGPLLGLRLLEVVDETNGQSLPIDGGLVLAGEQVAYARSRHPAIDEALGRATSLEQALADGILTAREAERYEVSIATGQGAVTHSTRPERIGSPIVPGEFAVEPDGSIVLSQAVNGGRWQLRFALDICRRMFKFDGPTPTTAAACDWLDREKRHLDRHAVIVR